MIPIELSKKQVLHVDSKAMLQIDFTWNLDRDGNTTMLLIIEEAKENILNFSQRTVRAFQI